MISKNDLECIRADFSDIDEQYRNIEQEYGDQKKLQQ